MRLILLLAAALSPAAAAADGARGPPPTPAPSPIQTEPYFTNFSGGRNAPGWTIADWCSHCGSSGGGSGNSAANEDGSDKDECTSNGPQNVDFGVLSGGTGFRINTAKIAESKSLCKTSKPSCSSAHNEWSPRLLYGSFETVARWFPGPQSSVYTATGFIGLDEPSNTASITMGFHGTGFPDPNKPGTGAHKYQHGIYGNNSQHLGHNREYTSTAVDMSQTFNSYALIWTPTFVTWLFNGKPVRNFTDAVKC